MHLVEFKFLNIILYVVQTVYFIEESIKRKTLGNGKSEDYIEVLQMRDFHTSIALITILKIRAHSYFSS